MVSLGVITWGASYTPDMFAAVFGSSLLDLIAFNLFPLAALGAGTVYSLIILYRLKDLRLGVFTILLILVAVAELIELRAFIAGNQMVVGSPFAEIFETVIHVFAAFSVLYISRYIEREREARNELERRQTVLDKYRQVFDKSSSPAILTDNNHCIVEANNAFVKESGFERDDLVGAEPEFLMEDEDVYEEIIETIDENQTWTGEIQATTKDGRIKHYQGSLVPILVNGKKEGYAGFFVDLTRRKRYEDSLEVMNRVLRHDLRNDMNVVKGYLEIIEGEIDDPELIGYIDKSREKADGLAQKSDTVRELERFLRDYLDSEGEEVEIDELIQRQLDSVQKDFEGVNYDVDLFEAGVVGGKPLSKAFHILLENAATHADEENPKVEARIENGSSQDSVIVTVADNGPGIPDSRKESVFGREEIDDLHHGRGLDLFFVDTVVQNYGGDAWIEDNEPSGTVFKIELQKA